MARSRPVGLSIPTLALLAAVAAPGLAAEGGASRPIHLEDCGPEGREGEMLCGTLQVPEDPDAARGRSVGLRIVVVPAVDEPAGPSALFSFEGGPGLAATPAAEFYLGEEGRGFRRGRDVVLVDQRGTGGSGPLRCPSTEDNGPLDDMYPADEVDECRAALEGHADLGRYGTWLAAGDLERVRQALGYEQVDLWALSYGTVLAQIYIRRFPSAVRSAFLVGATEVDGFVPLFHAVAAQRVLDLLFFECQSDATCRRAYPDLRAEWSRVLARLDQGPVRATRRDPTTGEEQVVEIRRGRFGEAFRGLLGSAASQRRVPYLIHRMADGDFGPFVEALGFGPSPFAEGLYLSIACSEGTSRIKPEEVKAATAGTFLGDWRVRQQMDACSRWPVAPVPPGFFEPLKTEVPVLVLAAAMDHVTPWSHRLCDGSPRCRVLHVPHLGHVPFDAAEWTGGECFDRLALELYRHGDVEAIDASCLRALKPPPFLVE